jgi:N-hydroxyarylamine O-acetyltransferase
LEVRDYLARIGAEFAGQPTLDALRRLHERHLESVPFENLDIHFGIPIVLEERAILDKVVRRRRGGFCYELNFAFHWLLGKLGYDIEMLSGEVARPDGGFGIPFDHMILSVRLGGERWLADVGFGESFVEPLRFVAESVQDEEPFRYRLRRSGEHWLLERCGAGESQFLPQYRFTTERRRLSDFCGGCEYHQTSPESHFTRNVVVSRALPGGRLTLTKNRLLLRRGEARTEITVESDAAWRGVLSESFGIALSEVPT